MKQEAKKIGILGGTFDPIHIGHLILAEHAREQYQLDTVYIMPNGNPKYKQARTVSDSTHRIEMVRLSIEHHAGFELSTLETSREGYTYTYETLESLKEQNPEHEYYFIIGADSLFDFEKWRYPDRICKACTLLYANRDEAAEEKLQAQIQRIVDHYAAKIYRVEIPTIGISSSMIRSRAGQGQSIDYYVTEKTAVYIKNHKLYSKI